MPDTIVSFLLWEIKIQYLNLRNKHFPGLKICKGELQKYISKDIGVPIPELALAFVRDLPGITSIVIGVENTEQLEGNMSLMSVSGMADDVRELIIREFSGLPEVLINPSKWNI